MADKLKPCLFCGATSHLTMWCSPPEDEDGSLGYTPDICVICGTCGCNGPEMSTEDDAVIAWNDPSRGDES